MLEGRRLESLDAPEGIRNWRGTLVSGTYMYICMHVAGCWVSFMAFGGR